MQGTNYINNVLSNPQEIRNHGYEMSLREKQLANLIFDQAIFFQYALRNNNIMSKYQ